MSTDTFTLLMQLSDAGNIITRNKYDTCFVTRHVVNQQQNRLQQDLGPYMCYSHYTLPSVKQGTDEAGNMLLRVECCCQQQLDNLSKVL